MANGHGGKRVGSGRKPKDAALRALDGNAGHRGRVLQHPSAPETAPAPAVIVDEEHAPDDLSTAERLVWLRLGALAREAGTLQARYLPAFSDLCRHVVLEQGYWTAAADTGGADHCRVIKIIHAEMDRFGLRPFGKAETSAPAKPAVDPVKEKYFGRG